MLKSGNKTLVDMESPRFWFLLVIPVTVAFMAYQYPNHTTNIHPENSISQPTDQRVGAMPTAAAESLPIRQAAASRDGGADAVPVPPRTVPEGMTTGPAPLPAEGQTAAVNRRLPDDRSTHVQGSSITATGGVNPGDDAPGTDSSAELTSEGLSEPPANADLASILEQNPYLPVAGEDSIDPTLADSSSTPPCPQVLFRGGNDYAVNRLALMGCEIPGG